MIGDRSQLTNLVQKFLGTVKFENDHVAKIMGYGDYKIGNFCDSKLKVAFRQHTCFIRNLEGVDLLTGSRGNNLYTLSLGDMIASSPICLLSKASKTKYWLWHRHLSHLNFGAINYLARQSLVRGLPKLKFEKDHLCSACAMGKKVVATACYTQNRSIVRLPHGKTQYELLHNKLPNLSFFHVFSALCYPTNDSENLGKLQPKADIGMFIGYAPAKKAFRIYNRRTRRIVETIHVDFDELTAMASEQSSSGPVLHEMTPATISSGLVPKPSSSTSFVPPSRNDWDLLFQPLQLSKAVSTRLRLHEQALFCCYDAFLTSVKPKTYKDALTQSCWIEAMQEELNELEQLEEEVYVSQPDGFVDQDNPNHVYKLKKALCGLKQAPRTWYDMLSSFLISRYFSKGSVDPTLFIRRNGNDLLLPVDLTYNLLCACVPDADHARCQDTCRSTSGSLQFLGGRLISWSLKRQKSAAISSTKAEYIALFGCCAQILWMRSQLTDYRLGFNKIPMYCDNKSAIALCCNNVQHSRSKHIDIGYYFIKEHVKNGVIELYFVNTEYQLANLFTKALGRDRIEFLINKLGMRSFTPETLKQLIDEVAE
nr:retrovirus-related Pol polyprotein from transposon TNT 1-94 [Tanacetum cinerariifolium]